MTFDIGYDHSLESVLMTPPKGARPFCVKRYCLCDGSGRIIAGQHDNHQSRTI